MAFVAYHFHWSRSEVMEMPHWERQRWCEEISEINERINEDDGTPTRGSQEQTISFGGAMPDDLGGGGGPPGAPGAPDEFPPGDPGDSSEW